MPVTNDELMRGAYNLTGAIIAMYRADGFDPDRIGEPDNTDKDVIATTIEDDAELFLSMDPDRLREEYDEIVAAARFTAREADPTGVIGRLHKELEPNWAGPAATEFSIQLSKIQSCIAVQHEYTLLAAQAVGMMFAVTTQSVRAAGISWNRRRKLVIRWRPAPATPAATGWRPGWAWSGQSSTPSRRPTLQLWRTGPSICSSARSATRSPTPPSQATSWSGGRGVRRRPRTAVQFL